ncbi:MAG: ubiquinol-cytochrome c reductase iron-sulfur subunit [Rhizomicrobium sp.]
MATTTTAEPTRRDFLYIATGSVAAVGAAAVLWPLIDQMNPSSAVLALASIEIDLTPIQVGQSVTFKFRGHPLFVRRRSPAENRDGQGGAGVGADRSHRPQSQPARGRPGDRRQPRDPSRMAGGFGVCTHLGCTPTAYEGDFGGWLCHCHGSQYDVAGRVRKGPAPQNLEIPVYSFLSPTRVKVG